jgi:6-phosphofructokinase 1
MHIPQPRELEVPVLGPPRFPSPFVAQRRGSVDESRRVLVGALLDDHTEWASRGEAPPSFEPAGPRERVFFDGAVTTCGILTCGGLCPGLNDVIRAAVMTLWHGYGVRRILGFRYGYAGISSNSVAPPLELTPASVERIHEEGGTVLGSSRGPQEVPDMVRTLQRNRVDILLVIGGDGTLAGARALTEEILRQGLRIAVVGVPKTIDNDLFWISRSFGFSTAVEEADRVLGAAHAEAKGAWNGVCLVKLMGRHSGYIAAHSTLASGEVNLCLVPEVPFTLDGLLGELEARLRERHHALVVVAEGAGQDLVTDTGPGGTDASGNVKLKDIGTFLRDRMGARFKQRGLDAAVRYIDPSYTIRSRAANSIDAEFCLSLGQQAAHAGMAGRTGMMVGLWNQHFTHVPLGLVAGKRRKLDPNGMVWQQVLATTGQPAELR